LTPAIAQQNIEVSHPAFHEVIIEDVSEDINISLNKPWVENNGFKVSWVLAESSISRWRWRKLVLNRRNAFVERVVGIPSQIPSNARER
jgi:hypothetical protein